MVCLERSWQRKNVNTVAQLCTLTKPLSEIDYLFINLDFPEKKHGGWWYIYFLEKPLKFLDLLPYPWKFWAKQSFIAGNRAKLFGTSWEQSKIICDFSWLSLKILHSSCFTSRILNASSSKLMKNPSPWIANFMTSLE